MINLEELAQAIQGMTRQQQFYKVLRDELRKRGFWRTRPRGNPRKGYDVMKAKRDGKAP